MVGFGWTMERAAPDSAGNRQSEPDYWLGSCLHVRTIRFNSIDRRGQK